MTRETKIGLLVGLAFIIVVGILLSDNMNAAREPAPAPLQIAGTSVRSGLGQPVSDADPSGAGPAETPNNPVPQQPVPTQEEVAPVPAPVAANIPPTAPIEVTNKSAHPAAVALANTARQSGEELVDSNNQPLTADTTTDDATTATPKPITLATRTYKALPGDTLGKIAQKLLGSGNKTNRASIVALNASLKEDPNKIIVGHTYTIPAAPVTSAAPAESAAKPPVTLADNTGAAEPTKSPSETASTKKPTSNTPTHIYTVKSGDTLWSIAVTELGDASTMAAIKDLNPKLNPNKIRANMKLVLPAKPVAAAE